RGLTGFVIAPISYEPSRGGWLQAAQHHDEATAAAYQGLWWEIALTLGPRNPRIANVGYNVGYVKTPEGVVGDVLVWHGAGASLPRFADDKAMLLQALLEYLPPHLFAPLHDLVLGELVTFLAGTGDSAERRVGWFLQVHDLLEYAM